MDNPKKILIIQLKRAGDVLLTTPVAALLKRRWPQAQVDFLTDPGFSPMLESNPSIDTILRYDKKAVWQTLKRVRAETYDLIFDFQSSPRSAVVCLMSGATITAGYRVPFWGRVYGRTVKRPGGGLSVVQGKVTLVEHVAGRVGDIPEPQLFLTEEERAWSLTALQAAPGQTVIGLVPTHRHGSRRWHGDSFAALGELLHAAGHGVWLFWGPGEREYVEGVAKQASHAVLTPPTSLRQMAALMARCDMIVTNDNGPMHVAAAVGAPTVTIYGPTDPQAWNPGGPRNLILQAQGLSCLGCNLNQCPFGHECMTGVTPQAVYNASEALRTTLKKTVMAG